jgi:hypothetical protein
MAMGFALMFFKDFGLDREAAAYQQIDRSGGWFRKVTPITVSTSWYRHRHRGNTSQTAQRIYTAVPPGTPDWQVPPSPPSSPPRPVRRRGGCRQNTTLEN